jgi:MoxR-like ATPase
MARWISEIERAVQGKPEVVRKTVLCLLARGHVLLEDVPGVGKTTLAHALARTVDGEFRRIQFTSDLLPGDLTGLSMPQFDATGQANGFRFQPGPLFGHLVLADEVNRASPKTQSALLEAMSEQTVTIDGVSHALPDPFFVIATQNPLEHQGTHALPESQLDRFLMRLSIGYPDRHHEARVLAADPAIHVLPQLQALLSIQDLRALQTSAQAVKIDESLLAYLLDLIDATRVDDGLALGASTRGALALRCAAQASALIDGRDYCIPEDIRDLAVDVLAHRVSVRGHGASTLGAEEAQWIVTEIVDRVPIPV